MNETRTRQRQEQEREQAAGTGAATTPRETTRQEQERIDPQALERAARAPLWATIGQAAAAIRQARAGSNLILRMHGIDPDGFGQRLSPQQEQASRQAAAVLLRGYMTQDAIGGLMDVLNEAIRTATPYRAGQLNEAVARLISATGEAERTTHRVAGTPPARLRTYRHDTSAGELISLVGEGIRAARKEGMPGVDETRRALTALRAHLWGVFGRSPKGFHVCHDEAELIREDMEGLRRALLAVG